METEIGIEVEAKKNRISFQSGSISNWTGQNSVLQ
jgi:hypothetical protein